LRKSTDRPSRPVSLLPIRRPPPQPFATPPAALKGSACTRPRSCLTVGSLMAWVLSALLVLPGAAWALNDAQLLVVEAWRLVNQSYVDPNQLEQLHWRQRRQRTLERSIETSAEAYGAIDAMLAAIGDPYTRMLRPADFAALRDSNEGTVSGVGLQLGLRQGDQQVVVIAPLDDSPAAEARIPSGAEVLSVNGRSTADLGLEGSAALLRGAPGSEVEIRVREKGGAPREVTLTRRTVDLVPVRSMRLVVQGHRLGYVRITQFSEPVPTQVAEALQSFLTAAPGTQPVEGLILDLRNNSGGLVSAGLAVANGLLGGAPIVETMDRSGITASQQSSAEQLFSGPMITLVNGGTASASEILAGALQDNGRSQLVGGQTFGKGLIQTLIPLGDGSGLAVTVAHYLTPSGRDIQSLGITPDLLLPQPEPLNPGGRDDPWLQAAGRLLVQELNTPEGRP
jgi:carboxyl-terminal processing protease